MTDRITGPFERAEPLSDRLGSWWARLTEPWSRPRDEFEIRLMKKINRLEVLMANVAEVVARLDAATNEVAADLKDVRDKLAAALADVDAEKQAAVDEALAAFDAPIARLEALGADPADPVPAPEPAPAPEPTPEPEPAPEDEQPA